MSKVKCQVEQLNREWVFKEAFNIRNQRHSPDVYRGGANICENRRIGDKLVIEAKLKCKASKFKSHLAVADFNYWNCAI